MPSTKIVAKTESFMMPLLVRAALTVVAYLGLERCAVMAYS